MSAESFNRIEEQPNRLALRYFSWITTIGLLLSIIAMLISADMGEDRFALLIVIMAIALILIIFAYRYWVQKHGTQFVEWTGESVVYKSRKRRTASIPVKSIQALEIHFDYVVFHLVNGNTEKFNFVDFHDVENRKRIKSNFKEMKPGK